MGGGLVDSYGGAVRDLVAPQPVAWPLRFPHLQPGASSGLLWRDAVAVTQAIWRAEGVRGFYRCGAS
jgi:hypothetical protein